MSFLADLRKGIAFATAAESGGVLVYRANGGYQAGEVGVHGLVLPESPDAALAMNLYGVDESVDTVLGLQFRFRAKSEGHLDAIEDALTNSWASRQNGTLNGVTLIQSRWSSGASLGQDSSGRITRSINFYITVDRPLTHRT